MKILMVDTSSTAASVAVIVDGNVLGHFHVSTEQTHSEKLMPMLDALLNAVTLKVSDFDAFGVCEGPGSFTGVRIGIATIKAFAQAFQKPVYRFSSLELIAASTLGEEREILTLIDAKRGQSYFGRYRWEKNHLTCIEEGHASTQALMEEHSRPDVCILDATPSVHHAVHLLMDKTPVHYDAVCANYMKPSQAERDQTCV